MVLPRLFIFAAIVQYRGAISCRVAGKRVIATGRIRIYCHEVVEMVRANKAADTNKAITVIFRHTAGWDQNRHVPAFLRPLVEGEWRRMAAAVKASPGAGPPAG